MARYGLNVADVQDAVSDRPWQEESPVLIYEGDRRFELQVRLPEQQRGDMEALKRLPIRIPAASASTGAGTAAKSCRCPPMLPWARWPTLRVVQGPNQVSRENGKRRVVVTANVRGRDLGSFVNEAETLVAEQVEHSLLDTG